MIHPVLNPDSIRYDTKDKMPAIYDIERELTLIEAIGWARGNVLKYKLRLGKKKTTTKQKDLVKIATYGNYIELLNECRNKELTEAKYQHRCEVEQKGTRYLLDKHYPKLVYKLETGGNK